MRLSLSHKVFTAFSLLSLVTVAFGATVFFGVRRIAQDHERASTLVAFLTTLTELGHFHDDGRFHLNFHEDNPGFRSTVGRAREMAASIGSWKQVAGRAAGHRFDLAEQMGFYQAASEELLGEEAADSRLRKEQHRLLLAIQAEAAEAALRGVRRAQELTDRVSTLGLESLDGISLPLLGQVRDLRERFGGPQNPSGALVDALCLSLERSYLSRLAIENRTEFLSDTMRHFHDDISSMLEGLRQEMSREEGRIRTLILAAVTLTVLATLGLWFISSRRITEFVSKFKFSLDNIRRGDFGYQIGPVREDELGDALRFMKDLAVSLEEKIIEADTARAEGEALQEQLVHAQKMESVGRLAGGVAHDFNNLLTGIMGFAELGLLRAPDESAERPFFQSIYTSAEKASRLTSQLLAFSRRQVLQRRNVDPNGLITECAKMLRRMIGDDIILDLRLQEGARAIFADPDQFDQVLLNLAVNARDSMPRGGRITISTENVFLDEGYAAYHAGVVPGHYVKIEVTDTGSGIPKEIQDKVFEPFFTTKEAGKGTGLGLAMVFGIVKQHEGQIWLYSEAGRGTTFKVYFPSVESAAEERATETISVNALQGSETILVVDDNADVRSFLQTALRLHGYRVLSASGKGEALEHIARDGASIDVLLTDLIMPAGSGRELADEVSRLHPEIKVIFMSGYADRVFLNGELRQDPTMHFLQKPVTPTVLLTKIREVCS